jgi:hypothetical protein
VVERVLLAVERSTGVQNLYLQVTVLGEGDCKAKVPGRCREGAGKVPAIQAHSRWARGGPMAKCNGLCSGRAISIE